MHWKGGRTERMKTKNAFSTSASYLTKPKNVYQMRLKVPPDLHQIIGKKELRFSLRTPYKGEARKYSRAIATKIQSLFMQLRESASMSDQKRQQELTPDQIQEIIRDYVQGTVEHNELDRAIQEKRLDSDQVDSVSLGFDAIIPDLKEALAQNDHVRAVGRFVDSMLTGRQLGLDSGSSGYRVLCREVLKAKIKLLEIEQRRSLGDYSDGNDLQVVESIIRGQHPGISQAADQAPEPVTSILLKDLIAEYSKQKIDAKRWRPRTVDNHRPKFNSLVQFLGNIPVHQITKEMMRNYRRLLDHLPPRFAQNDDYQDVGKVDIEDLKGKHEQTLDVTTKREYMTMAKSIFKYALENEYVTVNPVLNGTIPEKKKRAREQREPFTNEDLTRIFNPATYYKYAKDRPARFWVPILALYTGARLEELCQLHCEDVKQVNGLWIIDINGKNGKRVKNVASERLVPLQPFLVETIGFPRFVERVRQEGHKRVFHGLSKVNKKWGHSLSKDFGRYKTKLGLGLKKTFHSFRHNVTDLLYKKKVPESIIEELLGRSGHTETRTRYAKGHNLRTFYEDAVIKLDYGVDLGRFNGREA